MSNFPSISFQAAGVTANPEMAQALQNLGRESQRVEMLKYAKGDWSFGLEAIELEDGEKMVIFPNSLEHGYICWPIDDSVDNKPLGSIMQPVYEPLRPVAEFDLPPGAKAWESQLGFKALILEDDIEVMFTAATHGGREAVSTLASKIAKHMSKGTEYVAPIVELGTSQYPHKKYGTIKKPKLDIVDWMKDGGGLESEVEDIVEEVYEETVKQIVEETAKPKRRVRKAK